MSGQDLVSPDHGRRDEGNRLQSFLIFLSNDLLLPRSSLTLPSVLPQLRIPTCYDKPGTSQLVQSTSVRRMSGKAARHDFMPARRSVCVKQSPVPRYRVTAWCLLYFRRSMKWTCSGKAHICPYLHEFICSGFVFRCYVCIRLCLGYVSAPVMH